MEVLADRLVCVPDDISVVTFDNAGPLYLLNPAITAPRQDVDGMGQRAVDLLTGPDQDSGLISPSA